MLYGNLEVDLPAEKFGSISSNPDQQGR